MKFYQGFHFYLTANDYWLCRCYLCCILLNKTPARIVHYESADDRKPLLVNQHITLNRHSSLNRLLALKIGFLAAVLTPIEPVLSFLLLEGDHQAYLVRISCWKSTSIYDAALLDLIGLVN